MPMPIQIKLSPFYFTIICSDLALVALSVEKVVLSNTDVVPLECSGAHRASLDNKIDSHYIIHSCLHTIHIKSLATHTLYVAHILGKTIGFEAIRKKFGSWTRMV